MTSNPKTEITRTFNTMPDLYGGAGGKPRPSFEHIHPATVPWECGAQTRLSSTLVNAQVLRTRWASSFEHNRSAAPAWETAARARLSNASTNALVFRAHRASSFEHICSVSATGASASLGRLSSTFRSSIEHNHATVPLVYRAQSAGEY